MRLIYKLSYILLLSLTVAVQAESLSDLYKQTILSDTGLKIYQEQVNVGESELKLATSELLPQISISGNLSKNLRKDTSTQINNRYSGEKYQLVIQQKLLDVSKIYNRSRYKHLSDESLIRLKEKEILVTNDLIVRYLDTLTTQDSLELITSEKKAIEKQLQLLKSRYKRQLAVITDVLEVEARLDAIIADEIAAQAQVQISLASLAELLGRPVSGEIFGFMDNIHFDQDLKTSEEWTQLALKANPNLIALTLQRQAAEAGLKQAKAIDLPTIDVTLSAQKSNIGFENTQASENETYVASLNLSLPLYLGGRGSASKAQSRAQMNISQYEYEDARRKTLRLVREAYLMTTASLSRIQATKRGMTSAEKSYEAQQKGFTFGTVTVVDVLDALRNTFQVRRNHRQAQYDLVSNWIQLLNITGQLGPEHVELINAWQKTTP
jgi:outer membrane protein